MVFLGYLMDFDTINFGKTLGILASLDLSEIMLRVSSFISCFSWQIRVYIARIDQHQWVKVMGEKISLKALERFLKFHCYSWTGFGPRSSGVDLCSCLSTDIGKA